MATYPTKKTVCASAPDLFIHIFLKDGIIISSELHANPNQGFAYQISTNKPSDTENLVHRWMKDYSQGQNTLVNLPLDWQILPPYTAIVLKALQAIPFGSVFSYRDIAIQTANPKASRAVGNACARNPFPLFIPCHRVIASDGSLGGYSGGLPIKISLLDFETAKFT